MSAYVLLCLCSSEYQPLVIIAANNLDTAETVKVGQGIVALN